MEKRVWVEVILAASCASICGCSNGDLTPSATSSARGAAARAAISISQFRDLPGAPHYYLPIALAAGSDDALWVVDDTDPDSGACVVARIATSGRRTKTVRYAPTSGSQAWLTDIAAGPDGALWITDGGDGVIVRVTTGGKASTFSLGPGNYPAAIAAGPDGALWFTDNLDAGAAVGRITPNGAITTYSKGLSAGVTLQDIAAGPDGSLWFTESRGDRIGRITTQGAITEYSDGISRASEPFAIAAGADGAMWFTEAAASRIGRITTAGKVRQFKRGIAHLEHPIGIAAGPDGALWFTQYRESGGAMIGRITTSGSVSEYAGLGKQSRPVDIAAGSDGNMWFVENAANRTGRVNLQTSPFEIRRKLF